MIYSRWISLGVFILLMLLVFVWRGERDIGKVAKTYGMMFAEGMVGGLIIDSIGVNAGYYLFPRQPLYSIEYFAIVVPCWGVFGLLINCLWDWFGKGNVLKGLCVSLLPLLVFYEGTNLLSGSWIYHVHFAWVAVGWVPLVFTFAGCNKRRRVVWKVEQWRSNYAQRQGLLPQTIAGLLYSLKHILVVVMFPLLLVVLVKLLGNVSYLLQGRAALPEYKEYAVVTVRTWLAMQ